MGPPSCPGPPRLAGAAGVYFTAVAELVWAEIPGARAGIFKSPALLRHKAGEIQTARLQTHFLTLQITKH